MPSTVATTAATAATATNSFASIGTADQIDGTSVADWANSGDTEVGFILMDAVLQFLLGSQN
ncbi:MAG: hypothetical protein DCC68_05610 [Planctomycetota bacterium]|nr:MAG: hypothetical protein DCC68_05610 [Planctomycetota bacterium]